jgi:V/A-type H+-transporting ATPase subunit D
MIPPSRTQLLKIKTSKKLAVKGHSLLKRKRDGLIRKFFELISNYKSLKFQTINDLDLAYERLHIAQGVSGVNRVKGLSFSSNSNLKVSFGQDKIMGVEIQKVSCNEFDVDYNASLIGTSIDVDRVRDNFKRILPNMLKLSEIENTIFRLSEEIIKTKLLLV